MGQGMSGAVPAVAEDGAADGGQLKANLMPAAGLQTNGEQARIALGGEKSIG